MSPMQFCKQVNLIKGGGDGFRRDIIVPLREAFLFSDGSTLTTSLATNAGFAMGETNALVLSWAATKVVPAGYSFVIPGDYDESADDLRVRFLGQMSGATDAIALTINAYRKRAGAALTADQGPFTTKGTDNVAATFTNTSSIRHIDMNGKSNRANDIITLKITPPAHNTDAISIYGVVVRYKSNLALYTESDR